MKMTAVEFGFNIGSGENWDPLIPRGQREVSTSSCSLHTDKLLVPLTAHVLYVCKLLGC